MSQQALRPRRSRIPAFFRTPSTRLGWAAISGALAAIVMTIVINVRPLRVQGRPRTTRCGGAQFPHVILACMLGSGIAGLFAVVRRHERSWMVIVPCGLVLLVVVNELVQGLAELLS